METFRHDVCDTAWLIWCLHSSRQAIGATFIIYCSTFLLLKFILIYILKVSLILNNSFLIPTCSKLRNIINRMSFSEIIWCSVWIILPFVSCIMEVKRGLQLMNLLKYLNKLCMNSNFDSQVGAFLGHQKLTWILVYWDWIAIQSWQVYLICTS